MSMEKSLLEEMGRRYPRCVPPVILKWAEGIRAIDSLTHLNNLIDDHEVCIVLQKPNPIAAVVAGGQWWDNTEREFEAYFPMGIALKDDFSLNILSGGALEGIRMAREGFAIPGLISESMDEQLACTERIIADFLDGDAQEFLSTWKILVEAHLDTSIKELPAVRFTFQRKYARIIEILIDGWSGSLFIDGGLQSEGFVPGMNFMELVGGSNVFEL